MKLSAEKFDIEKNTICGYFCLAFVNSCLGFQKEALEFSEKASNFENELVLGTWSRGYRFLFLALTYKELGILQKSLNMYNEALEYSCKSHYQQVQAKSLCGLSVIYREKLDFQPSLVYSRQSIEILERIGAKCDLAEAYFQLGLTYQVMGEMAQAIEFRDKALQLFQEMEAPKQIERVTKAFNA